MKRNAIFILIFSGFLFSIPSTVLGDKREHFMTEMNSGYSFAQSGDSAFHWGYNFQFYPSQNFGIQLEYLNQSRYSFNDQYFLLNLIFKFQVEKIRRFYPYVSLGLGGIPQGLGWVGNTIKLGSGIKYRLLEKIKPFLINLNTGLFIFHSDGIEPVLSLSFSFGLEIGL